LPSVIEILSLCTSMPIYLVLVIRAFLSGAVELALKPYSTRAPFKLRRVFGHVVSPRFPFSISALIGS
jgi:hypothetical protein